MAKIILISCVSKKQSYPTKAEKMYISPLFQKNMLYAKSLEPDKIFILSAKHGLLKLDQKIAPYDETLNSMQSSAVKEWARKVLKQLKKQTNIERDEFTFLAGEKYRKFLTPISHIIKYP